MLVSKPFQFMCSLYLNSIHVRFSIEIVNKSRQKVKIYIAAILPRHVDFKNNCTSLSQSELIFSSILLCWYNNGFCMYDLSHILCFLPTYLPTCLRAMQICCLFHIFVYSFPREANQWVEKLIFSTNFERDANLLQISCILLVCTRVQPVANFIRPKGLQLVCPICFKVIPQFCIAHFYCAHLITYNFIHYTYRLKKSFYDNFMLFQNIFGYIGAKNYVKINVFKKGIQTCS
jgi:hypothetical protein